jgi:1,4-alpha-glucan branching enzyme
LVVLNMTPVPREGYRIGVPAQGTWRGILNTDAAIYGGSGAGNGGVLTSTPQAAHGQPRSLLLTLPPLCALILKEGA